MLYGLNEINGDVKKNRGYMTVEASLLVPIILFGVFIMIMGMILVYERSCLMATEYERLYSVPLEYIRADIVEDYLASEDYNRGLYYKTACVETAYVSHLAVCDGVLKVRDNIEITGEHEIDVCTDRLRRWQLYDDIAEKQGD
ncbi:MAG: hypothetical protein K6E10_03495 [Eubacterium sp.]|nr:hypothetical protein [Eubacterium sp.]